MNSIILCDLTQECRNKCLIGTDCLGSVDKIQQQVEMVQRIAARFVKSRYTKYSSVSHMLDEFGCPPLSEGRREA